MSSLKRGKGFYLKQNMRKALVALRNTSESKREKEGKNPPEKESYSIKLMFGVRLNVKVKNVSKCELRHCDDSYRLLLLQDTKWGCVSESKNSANLRPQI